LKSGDVRGVAAKNDNAVDAHHCFLDIGSPMNEIARVEFCGEPQFEEFAAKCSAVSTSSAENGCPLEEQFG